jgi:hypothetical protein
MLPIGLSELRGAASYSAAAVVAIARPSANPAKNASAAAVPSVKGQ